MLKTSEDIWREWGGGGGGRGGGGEGGGGDVCIVTNLEGLKFLRGA